MKRVKQAVEACFTVPITAVNLVNGCYSTGF
jgi:ribosomal protein L23